MPTVASPESTWVTFQRSFDGRPPGPESYSSVPSDLLSRGPGQAIRSPDSVPLIPLTVTSAPRSIENFFSGLPGSR